MSESNTILFYDIASGPPVRPFAPNPWKTRYALNFKRVNYKTQWTELPDVTKVRKSLEADPVRWHPSGEAFYTLPVIKDTATGKVIGDSFDIAVYLDKKYPDGPSLFPHSSIGIHKAFNTQADAAFPSGGALFHENLPFNPETAEQSKLEFGRRLGMKWEDLVVTGEARREVLDAYKVTLGDFAKNYQYSDGPFLHGQDVSYADFIVGGWLMMLSETVAEFDEILTWHGGLWKRIHSALEPYRQNTS
ncbi:hypothetical protein F5Y15DRAFT_98989 [Xylariaceae sp. FL0016]|nr:hypothetical protein F5Y15DRAFT_98989 [Xylariaceae sp. FL0016]